MQDISFFIELDKVPTTTAQQKKVTVRNGKPIFYEPQKLKEARKLFEYNLMKHAPKEKLQGAILLKTVWCFKRVKNTCGWQYKITRPDTDNLQKLLKDCMTKVGFWKDDSQVAYESVIKVHNNQTGIYVEVRQLKEKIYLKGE